MSVTCFSCRKKRVIEDSYRCYFCKHFFCEVCAKEHFEIIQAVAKLSNDNRVEKCIEHLRIASAIDHKELNIPMTI